MRLVLQRVREAVVWVEKREVARIDSGLVVLAGFHANDRTESLGPMAERVARLRIFDDPNGRMSRSLEEAGGELLLVPEITLACAWNGARPSFDPAASPEHGRGLFDEFARQLSLRRIRVATGVFRAHMQVRLVNDGPVTFVMESESSAR